MAAAAGYADIVEVLADEGNADINAEDTVLFAWRQSIRELYTCTSQVFASSTIHAALAANVQDMYTGSSGSVPDHIGS